MLPWFHDSIFVFACLLAFLVLLVFACCLSGFDKQTINPATGDPRIYPEHVLCMIYPCIWFGYLGIPRSQIVCVPGSRPMVYCVHGYGQATSMLAIHVDWVIMDFLGLCQEQKAGSAGKAWRAWMLLPAGWFEVGSCSTLRSDMTEVGKTLRYFTKMLS